MILAPGANLRSLGMYGTDPEPGPHPSERQSIGERTARLSKDADAGLTISPQSKSPGDDHEANWLPSRYLSLYLP